MRPSRSRTRSLTASLLAVVGGLLILLGVRMIVAAQQGGMFALVSLQVGAVSWILAAIAIGPAVVLWRGQHG